MLLSFAAKAGTFSCVMNANSEIQNQKCSNLIVHEVTDYFTRVYPSSKFDIVIVANYSKSDDGVVSGFSLSGVSPKGTDRVPESRFITQFIINDSQRRTKSEYIAEEELAIKDSIRQLMQSVGGSDAYQQDVPQSNQTMQSQKSCHWQAFTSEGAIAVDSAENGHMEEVCN